MFAVCEKTLERFSATLTKDQLTKPKEIEKEFRAFCKDLKQGSKENRFVSSKAIHDINTIVIRKLNYTLHCA